MSNTLIVGGGGGTFPGSTELTNLLTTAADDLQNAVWTKTDTVASATQLTFTIATGRTRRQYYTVVDQHQLLFVHRMKAAGVSDNANKYYDRIAQRYYDNVVGDFISQDQRNFYDPITPGVPAVGYLHTPVLNDGVFRNYFALLTAQGTGSRAMFDIYGDSFNTAGAVIDYENFGMYDIEGLSGWVHDPLFPQVRFNLDKGHVWWGDSIGVDLAFRMGQWLNVINSDDRCEGGERVPKIVTNFQSAPELHSDPTIIWAGHNDVGDARASVDILADIATITDELDSHGTDYRVLTLIPNKNWTTTPPTTSGTIKGEVDAGILSAYGVKAVDVYAHLQTKGDGGANDIADVAAGLIPRSLQLDDIHLNKRGEDFAMDVVYTSINVAGWHG